MLERMGARPRPHVVVDSRAVVGLWAIVASAYTFIFGEKPAKGNKTVTAIDVQSNGCVGVREVERFGESLPEGSYGRHNRQAIAARETRVATRLRAVEQAYRTAIDRDAVVRTPEPPENFVLPSLRPTGNLK